ncbi:MAG: dienelactone hydrolase family protein [Acidobacteria bacterium]|nr:dienelactone hydrolase family protein [Acidobacteriota bacterium]
MSDVHVNVKDLHPEVWKLFDRYVHGLIDRRGFLDGAAKYAVGGLTAAGILDALSPRYAEAQQVAPNDPRVTTERIEVKSPQGYGVIRALLARPANSTGKLPAVIVIHENRGLNPHIEDVVRRAAVAGFMAIGPDALTSLGGYPGTDEKGVEMQRTLDQAKMMADFVATARYVKNRPDSTGRLGAVGFCFGGGVVNNLAVQLGADLHAGVPFYGGAPRAEDVPKIKAAMLINYAQDDERINAMWPAYEAALKANRVAYQMFTYPGTMHGFHNDTTPRFNKEQAAIAWQRTIEHFNRHLKSTS